MIKMDRNEYADRTLRSTPLMRARYFHMSLRRSACLLIVIPLIVGCASLDSHHGRGPNTNLAAVPEMKVAMRNAVRQIVELTPVTTTS